MGKFVSVAAVVILVWFGGACASLRPSAFGMLAQMDLHDVAYPAEHAVAGFIEGDSHAAYLPKLRDYAAFYGIEVLDDTSLSPSQWGWYRPAHAKIGINPFISPNGQVATLAHEIAHVFQPESLLGSLASDVWAEAVSFRYCQEIGLDISKSSFDYLRGAPEVSRLVIRTLHVQIDQQVMKLVKGTR